LDPTRGFTANTSWVDQAQSVSFAYTSVSSSQATSGTGINGTPTVELDGGGTGVAGYFSSSNALSTIVSASAWTALLVFKYTGSVADTVSYVNAGIIEDTGGDWWQTVSTTKLHAGQYSGGVRDDATPITPSTNYYALIKFDGSKVYTSLNGAAFDAGVASGNISTLTSPLVVASDYAKTVGFKGSFGDLVVWNVLLGSTDLAAAQAWAHARYGI
jgi:hypothetical protein